jgi:hypothetical protein
VFEQFTLIAAQEPLREQGGCKYMAQRPEKWNLGFRMLMSKKKAS